MMLRWCVLSVLLLATVGVRDRLAAPPAAPDTQALSQFPSTIGSWTGTDSPLDQDVLKTAAVDDYLNRNYRSDKAELGLYVGYYKSQRKGEALHSPLQCLPISPIDRLDPAGESKAMEHARPFAAQVLPDVRARLFKS